MCHKKLSVRLCDNVNFIHGQNGSGKSAILAALQICLGAGAKRTNRARNLKDLVRREGGATQAKVRVTLLNRGPDAYQHNVYGDTITIERTITLGNSGGGYKLYDENMNPQSDKKKDLLDMLDQLNIQVENPVAVLDQEEAKKFLTGKPEDKYLFFTKATDLERLDRRYADTVDNINELHDSLERMARTIEPLEQNVSNLKKEYEDFKILEKLEVKESEANVKYAWSFYTQCLTELEQEKKVVETQQAKVASYKEKIEQAENESDNSQVQKDLEEKLATLTAEAEEASRHQARLREEYKSAIGPKKALEHKLKMKKNEVNQSKKDLVFATKELQNKRDEIVQKKGSADSEEASRQARAKEAENKIEEAKSFIEEARKGTEESLQKYEEGKSTEEALGNNVRSIQSQCNAVKSKIQELQRSQGNSLAIFGPKCEAMNKAVIQAQNQGKFRDAVIGPIGKYMKIVTGKEHYAALAEKALQLNLDRYIVTNSHDRQVYLKLREQVGCGFRDCGVYQMSKVARYNIRQPPEGVDVVSSVITSSEDVVFNCMVDNGRCDQKAVCESWDVSQSQLLEEHSSGKVAIRGNNIKSVYYLPSGDFWQVFNGEMSVTSAEKAVLKGASIGMDKSRAIKEAESEYAQLKQEIDSQTIRLNEVKKERQGQKVKWNDWKKKLAVAQAQINKYTEDIERIREESENAENITFDTSDLEDEVNKAQEQYDRLKAQLEEMSKSIEELNPDIEKIQSEIEEVTSRNEKIAKELRDCEEKLGSQMQLQQQRERNLQKKKDKLQQAEDALQKQQEVVESKENKTQDTLRKARIMTLRVQKGEENRKRRDEYDEGKGEELDLINEDDFNDEELESIEPVILRKAPEYYAGKIRQLQKAIERERKSRRMTESNPEVALEKYLRAKKALDTKLYQIEEIEKNKNLLIADVRDRKEKWKKFRGFIKQLTNHNFDEFLNKKGSSGQIKFDDKNKTLDVIVQKDNRDKHSQTADVKALSGGERSFTTLALLLALGESLETPFRVMDEFDVFLDPVARRIALNTMIEVAKEFEHRQFIFITPQDLSNIKTDPKLMIHQLKPPKRQDVVGRNVQQTID